MAETIEERACELAVYIIETGATVRTAANTSASPNLLYTRIFPKDSQDTTSFFTCKCGKFWMLTGPSDIYEEDWQHGKNTKFKAA